MAKANGFTCDVPGCGKFSTGSGEMPKGWMTLVIDVTVPKAGTFADGGATEEKKFVSMHICSDKCLMTVARGRLGKLPGMKPTKAVAEETEQGNGLAPHQSATRADSAKKAQSIRWHREGKHDGDPRIGCPLCEEETAPEKVDA